MEGLHDAGRDSFDGRRMHFAHDYFPSSTAPKSLSKQELQDRVLFETAELETDSDACATPGPPQNLTTCSRRQRPASELLDFFAQSRSGPISPRLILIHIESQAQSGSTKHNAKHSLSMTSRLFNQLVDDMRMNHWLLWLLSNKYDGFHHVKAQGRYVDSFFFGFFHAAMVWTFVPATACTKVLLINRSTFQPEALYDALKSYAPRLHTPLVPLMACVICNVVDNDRAIDRHAGDIVDVERKTGFSYRRMTVPDMIFDSDNLTTWSKDSSDVQINVINRLRHHDNCMRALRHIEDMQSNGILKCPNDQYKTDWDNSISEILTAVQCLKMRSDAFVPYATYIKSRAEAQISVIFALLTHEDSTANLNAAEAAKDIAAATKNDSSAMKTIAFMTMSFLPATFLATLFALPVLEWEHKIDVRTDGFQLYWIVAVVSTIVVFVVWAIITKWRAIQAKLVEVLMTNGWQTSGQK